MSTPSSYLCRTWTNMQSRCSSSSCCCGATHSLMILDEWNMQYFRKYTIFNERACRKVWGSLDLPYLKKVFTSVHRAGVAPNHIPNVVMRSLCEDFLMSQEAKSHTLTQCTDEQVQHLILHAPAAPAAQNEAPPPIDGLDLFRRPCVGLSRRRCIRLGPRLVGREIITHG